VNTCSHGEKDLKMSLYGESQFYSQLSERAPAIGECLIGKAVR
jgi:hypothetical protein